jgi:hypothetical protein
MFSIDSWMIYQEKSIILINSSIHRLIHWHWQPNYPITSNTAAKILPWITPNEILRHYSPTLDSIVILMSKWHRYLQSCCKYLRACWKYLQYHPKYLWSCCKYLHSYSKYLHSYSKYLHSYSKYLQSYNGHIYCKKERNTKWKDNKD